MKKNTLIIISIIIALMVFACSWEMPEAIRVKGTVGIDKFTLNYNLGKEIADAIRDSLDFDDDPDDKYFVNVLYCENAPDVFTYLAHIDIPLVEFEGWTGPNLTLPLVEFPLKSEPLEFTKIEMPEFLDFGNIDYVDTKFKAKVYIYFTNTAEVLTDPFDDAEIRLEVVVGSDKLVDNKKININPSGIKQIIRDGTGIYPYPVIPGSPPDEFGLEIEFDDLADALFAKEGNPDREDLLVTLKITDTMTLQEFSEGFKVFAEIVLWLPMEIAVLNEYVFTIPFDNDDDLFDRKAPEETIDYIEYVTGVNMGLEFNKPVFDGTYLRILNGDPATPDFFKKIDLGDKTMKFGFTKEEMDDINKPENNPFIPEMSIVIPSGGRLRLLKDLTLQKISLIANIDYYKKFKD